MALSRKTLRAMGLTEEQVESIVEAHTETVNALKDEIARNQADAERVTALERDLEDARTRLEESDRDGWKVRYEEVKAEFEGFKADVEARRTREAKENAYRELLKGIGIPEKRLDSVLRVTDLTGAELDESGKLKDADALAESAKTEWADFIGPAESGTAPRLDTGGGLVSGGSARTKQEIMQIKDTTERQRALAEFINTQKGS